MEGSGLDFGAPRLDFGEFWDNFFEILEFVAGELQELISNLKLKLANTLPPTCPASLGRSRPKSGRDLAEPQDVCLECLCFRVLAAMREVLTEWVAGGVLPLGAFNPPATEGVPTAC